MENRVYDFGLFLDELDSDLRHKVVEGLITKYLKAGVHPYYIAQTIRIASTYLSFQMKERLTKHVDYLLKSSFSQKEAVPEPWEPRMRRAVSRLYDQSGNYHAISDQGILFGVIVEFFADAAELFRQGRLEDINEACGWLAERVLEHPLADFGVLDSLKHAVNSLHEHVEGETIAALPFQATLFGEDFQAARLSAKKQKKTQDAFVRFLKNRISSSPIQEIVREILENWTDKAPVRVYSVLTWVMAIHSKVEPNLPHTKVLNALLWTSLHGGSRASHAAKQILRAYPTDSLLAKHPVHHASLHVADSFSALEMVTTLIYWLKSELPTLETRHAIIRWFQQVPEKIEDYAIFLAFGSSSTIDPNAEILFEDIFGPKTWEAVCSFQDPSLWNLTADIYPGRPFRSGIRKETPQYRAFHKAIGDSNLKRHQPSVAEKFERDVFAHHVSAVESQKIFDSHLNLLSGEIVMAVTHLRDEWMRIKRKQNEFLGSLYPEVEICRYKRYGDNGAACRFRFKVSGSSLTLKGALTPEGEAELENTPILNDQSKLALQAMIVQAVCSILIPQYTDVLPSLPQGGQGFPAYRMPLARRSVVHTVGKVEVNGQDRIESAGTKINPIMVELLFRWLIGEKSDYSFRLYVREKERIADESEAYFITLREAKEKLLARAVALDDVYLRVIRAHTRPAGVYLDETKTLRVKKMSARAKRNYDRYRSDGGRELDFSAVSKTYIVPGNIRVPALVPRTFVQGSFASLREALEFMLDPELKARAKQSFNL